MKAISPQKAALLLAAAGLWIYAALRAQSMSFTHDESLTYTIVMGDEARALTPNHHYFNTWCMAFLATFLGPSELALRLGSLFAFAGYLAIGLYLLQQMRPFWVALAGFALLFLNPFVLDFFSLARGYSWAMLGLLGMIWSLYELSADAQDPDAKPQRWWIFGLLSSMVAVLGNLALLNVIVPYFGMLILLAWPARARLRELGGLKIVLWLLATVAVFGFAISEAIRLKKRGEFYFGGQDGFVHDTIGSLSTCSLYDQDYGSILVGVFPKIILAVGVLLVFTTLANWLGGRERSFYALAGSLLTLTVICVVAQHLLIHTPLPTDRMATYFLILFGAAVMAGLNQLAKSRMLQRAAIGKRISLVLSVLVGALLLLHFGKTANLSYTYMWKYDQNTKAIMLQMPAIRDQWKPGQRMSLAAHALYEPACNFYRVTKGYDWLDKIPDNGVPDRMTDCYYTQWDDFERIPEHTNMQELARFESTKTACWKRK